MTESSLKERLCELLKGVPAGERRRLVEEVLMDLATEPSPDEVCEDEEESEKALAKLLGAGQGKAN